SDADPAPDGRTALATRCTGGACAVVRVDLTTGAVATVLPGDPARSYYRPRISPDGRRFVVSASDSGRWRLALAADDGGGLRFIGPDDRANRYDAAFAGHDTLVYASDLGGVIDLAALDLRTNREWPLTRVTGAAVAPAPDPADGSIWFLSLHARGYDVRRLAGDSSAGAAVSIVGKYGAASPPEPLVRPRMPGNPVRGPLPYGLGARHTRWLPGESFGPDGFAAAAYVTNIDVIGRLDAFAGGSFGARPQWNGATFGAAWRGSRVVLEAGAHYARRDPRLGSAAGVAPVGLNATRAGGLVAASFDATGDQWRWRARAGVGAERLTLGDRPAPAARAIAFLEWSGAVQQSRGRRAIAEHLAVHADAGRTAGSGVRRIVASASLGETGVGPVPLVLSGTWGYMNGSALAFERFSAGGLPSPLVDSSLAAAQYPTAGLPYGAIVPDAPGRASSLFSYRAAIPLGGLTPYYEAVSIGTGAGRGAWHRLAGVELAFATPPIPLGYLPGADVLLGVARSFDPPFAGRTTVYSGIRLVP
ncbi:MAG TPA: hypothetical protein VFT41_05600, partial [Gemmatimonadaceae bacterium]|nr:hypothetical protein [Gemmatimonadaceae bacterium]